jgi:hypothetical protein
MSSFRRYSVYVLAYILWAVSMILGGMGLLQLRDAYLSAVVISSFNRNQNNATALFNSSMQTRTLDTWSYLLLGLVLVILIVFLEYFYRSGVLPGKLRRRFFKVTTFEFGILFIANLTSTVVVWQVSGFTWGSLFYPILELLTTGIFIWLWAENRRRFTAASDATQTA